MTCSCPSVRPSDDLHSSIQHRHPANSNRAMVPITITSMLELFRRSPYAQPGIGGSLHTTPTQSKTNQPSNSEICTSQFCRVKPDPDRVLHHHNTQASRHAHSAQEVPPATSTSMLFLKLSPGPDVMLPCKY